MLNKQLEKFAYDFAIEIHEGKWDHVSDPHSKSKEGWDALIEELRCRCHGFTHDDYARAIADGLSSSK